MGLGGPSARPVAADDELPAAAVNDREGLAHRCWRWRHGNFERSSSFSSRPLERIGGGRRHNLPVDICDVAVPELIRFGRTGLIAVECCQK
jgi:hypothetical protein